MKKKDFKSPLNMCIKIWLTLSVISKDDNIRNNRNNRTLTVQNILYNVNIKLRINLKLHNIQNCEYESKSYILKRYYRDRRKHPNLEKLRYEN